MKTFPSRKPHAGNAGYVCERKARLGGHIVVYDREKGFEIDAGERWIIMHEPSSRHIAVRTERDARQLMKALADARTIDEAVQHADGIFPASDLVREWDSIDAPPARRRHQAGPTDEQRAAALERFLADPENEPSADGKAALRQAFDLEPTLAPRCRNCDAAHWPYQPCQPEASR